MLAADLSNAVELRRFRSGETETGVSDEDVYIEMISLLGSSEVPVRLIACQVLLELSHNSDCCVKMIQQGCLQALICCVDNCICGRDAAHAILHLSDIESASPICLSDVNILLFLRALRDEDVTWNELICLALARASRWPCLPGLSVGSTVAIVDALALYFGSSLKKATSNQGLSSVDFAVFNISAEKYRRSEYSNEKRPIRKDMGYLVYAASHCIGKEVEAGDPSSSYFSKPDNRARILFIVEQALRPESSVVEASGASLLLHNCVHLWLYWDIDCVHTFVKLVGTLLQKCGTCKTRFSGLNCALLTCRILSNLPICCEYPEILKIINTYAIEFGHFQSSSGILIAAEDDEVCFSFISGAVGERGFGDAIEVFDCNQEDEFAAQNVSSLSSIYIAEPKKL